MIYLIDDNQNNQRMINYNIHYTDDGSFEGYLKTIEKLEVGNSYSDISHLEFLRDADCILLHDSTEDFDKNNGFISGSKTNSLKIKEIIADDGDRIPLVLFSNSMGEAEYDFEQNPSYISSVKKNIFYENLLDFLKFYKRTGCIDLRIIAWGKNFESREISELVYKLNSSLEMKPKSSLLQLSDLSESLVSFKLFLELSNPGTNINKVLIDFEDNPISIENFKMKLNKIKESYEKYGRNIYPWE